jgi:hypothetical protein
MTLMELLITILFSMMLLVSTFTPQQPYIGQSQQAANDLNGAFLAAAHTAQRTPDGVTVVVSPIADNDTLVQTFAGRPDGAEGALLDQKTLQEPVSIAGATTFAFAVNPDGSAVEIAPYVGWAAAAGGGTPCTSVVASVGLSTILLPTTISCTTFSATF